MTDDDGSAAIVRLADGRALAFAEYGDRTGEPVMFFHGVPGSRLGARPLAEAAARCGIRLIAPDRPGMGLSSPLATRTIADWPRDVAELATALSLDHYSVIGVSGGMPYVLACSIAADQRLVSGLILSGMGRFDIPDTLDGMDDHARRVYSMSQQSQRFAGLWVRMFGRLVKSAPSLVLDVQKRGFSAPDREAISRPDTWQARVDDLQEAFREGASGVQVDARLHMSDWHLDLNNVKTPVTLWYGRLDRSHPVAMATHYASVIPGSRLIIEDDVGSLGYLDRLDSIFRTIPVPTLSH